MRSYAFRIERSFIFPERVNSISLPIDMKTKNEKTLILAAYSIMAVLLFILETVIPKPIPFLRIGLANVFILLILVQLDLISALAVTVGKVILGNLFSGLIFTPLILFSLVGSLLSLLTMWLVYRSSLPLSLIGISICGAVTHLFSQLVLGYFLFIQTPKIFSLIPLLLMIGLASGLITGILAIVLFKNIRLSFDSR